MGFRDGQAGPLGAPFAARPFGGGIPLLASRGCPEFCTYCPHRILAGHRSRSVGNIVDELEALCDEFGAALHHLPGPALHERSRAGDGALRTRFARGTSTCGSSARHVSIVWTTGAARAMRAAGLRAISFGVESVSPDILKRVGRRPTPEAHQRSVIDWCREPASSRRRSTCSAFRRTTGLHRRDDRLRDRHRLDRRAVQAPDPISRRRRCGSSSRRGSTRPTGRSSTASRPPSSIRTLKRASSGFCWARRTIASTCGRPS